MLDGGTEILQLFRESEKHVHPERDPPALILESPPEISVALLSASMLTERDHQVGPYSIIFSLRDALDSASPD